jgi:hypothetical protein
MTGLPDAAERIGTSSPDAAGLAAAMRLVRLRQAVDERGARALEDRLLGQHRVVVPVTYHGGGSGCGYRLSCTTRWPTTNGSPTLWRR